MDTRTAIAVLWIAILFAGCAGRSEPGRTPGAEVQVEVDPSAPPVAYTCAHHPRVMEAEAGDCPLCGMALAPTTSVQTSPLRQRDDNPAIDPTGGSEGPD